MKLVMLVPGYRGNDKAEVFYENDTGIFTVKVTFRDIVEEGEFEGRFVPSPNMDQHDVNKAALLADHLSYTISKQKDEEE